MRKVLSKLFIVWQNYENSFDLKKEISESRPALVVPVVLIIVVAILAFSYFPNDPYKLKHPYVPMVAILVAGTLSLIAWKHYVRWPRMARVIQLFDVPLCSISVIWLGVCNPMPYAEYTFLLFYIVMTQKWARQYEANFLSTLSVVIIPASIGVILKWDYLSAAVLFGNVIFFLHTSTRTRLYRKQEYDYFQSRLALIRMDALYEGSLKEQDRMRILAHDLKNKVYPLDINISYLRTRSPRDKEEKAAIEESLQISRELSQKLKNIMYYTGDLTFYLPAVSDKISEEFGLHEYTKKGTVYAHKDFHVIVDTEIPKIEVRGSISEVGKVISNLINNAIDAGAREATISAVHNESEKVADIYIADNGPGIPAQIRDRLFQQYTTYGKKHGTGLGLFLSRRIVESFGGRLELSETSSEGTKFHMMLLEKE